MKPVTKSVKLVIFMVVVLLAGVAYSILKPEKSRDELLLERSQMFRELQQAGKNEEAMKLYQAMMEDAFKGKIELAGTVVDAQGIPLNDVQMSAETFEPDMSNHLDYTKGTVENEVINGTFKYSCSDCVAATLTFKKAGYHRTKYNAVTTSSRDREVIKLNETVVMELR